MKQDKFSDYLNKFSTILIYICIGYTLIALNRLDDRSDEKINSLLKDASTTTARLNDRTPSFEELSSLGANHPVFQKVYGSKTDIQNVKRKLREAQTLIRNEEQPFLSRHILALISIFATCSAIGYWFKLRSTKKQNESLKATIQKLKPQPEENSFNPESDNSELFKPSA